MKHLLILALILTFATWTKSQTVSNLLKDLDLRDRVKDTKDFIDAFLRTTIQAEGIEISGWIDDDTKVTEGAKKILSLIQDGLVHHLEEILVEFNKILVNVPSALTDCENKPMGTYKFDNWAADFKNVTLMEFRLYEAIYYHPERIMDNIQKMANGFESKNYVQPGESLGDILHLLFEEIEYQHVDEVFEGLRQEQEEIAQGQE